MLPEIKENVTKPYIYFFIKKFGKSAIPYAIENPGKNRLVVKVAPVEGCGYGRLHIIMRFDRNDNVRTAIDTDDMSFYTGLFYMEVIRKKRDNEAWQIVKERYDTKIALEKYIYFLLNAPSNIIDLIPDT